MLSAFLIGHTHLWSRVPHYGKVLGTLLSLSYWSLLEVFHLPLFSEPFWMKGEREENYSTLSLCIRRRFLISIVCTFRTRWVPFFVLLPLLLMNTISWLQNVCLGNVHFVHDNHQKVRANFRFCYIANHVFDFFLGKNELYKT